MLNGFVDPTGNYVASIGSDSNINIYKLINNKTSVELLTKVKFSDKKVQADRTSMLDFQWLGDGETILLPGKTNLVFIQKDDDNEKEWGMIEEPSISHSSEITAIKSISNEVLMTYSQGAKDIKVWRLTEDGSSHLYTFKVQNPAIAIEYDSVTKCLAVMDNECKIGVCQRDLETGEEPASQASEGIDVDELDGFELASDMVMD